MTTREILTETLKLMHTDYDTDVSMKTWDDLTHDENYSGYVAGMYGAINRCLSDLENKSILPSKRHEIEANNLLASGNLMRYDTTLIEDYNEVDRIIMEDGSRYIENTPYSFEGSMIVLPKISNTAKYILLYKPKIKRVTMASMLDDVLDIPDSIANFIPYYCKFDLFQEDEPQEAMQSFNIYQQEMDNYRSTQMSKQLAVESEYNLWEM